MDICKNLSLDDLLSPKAELKLIGAQEAADPRLSHIQRLLPPAHAGGGETPLAARASPGQWSDLIERVRNAATRVREAEAQAQEQEARVHDLLERVREDIASANARVKAAEAHTREIQAQAEALLKAAEERAAAVEERARVAEAWLARVYETITREFSFEQPESRIAS